MLNSVPFREEGPGHQLAAVCFHSSGPLNHQPSILQSPTAPSTLTYLLLPSMPKKSKASAEKQQKNAAKEAAKIAARKAFLDQENKPDSEKKSIRKIAEEHGVDHSVLSRLIRGQPTMAEFNAEKQLFTRAEERTIVDFLVGMGKRGFPLTHRMIYEKAVRLLEVKSLEFIAQPLWNGVEQMG